MHEATDFHPVEYAIAGSVLSSTAGPALEFHDLLSCRASKFNNNRRVKSRAVQQRAVHHARSIRTRFLAVASVDVAEDM